MDLELTSEQQTQLELISLHAGKAPDRLLMDAVLFLLDQDVRSWGLVQRGAPTSAGQNFLEEDELNARFEQLLRR